MILFKELAILFSHGDDNISFLFLLFRLPRLYRNIYLFVLYKWSLQNYAEDHCKWEVVRTIFSFVLFLKLRDVIEYAGNNCSIDLINVLPTPLVEWLKKLILTELSSLDCTQIAVAFQSSPYNLFPCCSLNFSHFVS